MAEFHKMAGVINGVAQCFAMEDEECELFMCCTTQQTSLIPRPHGLYRYETECSQYLVQYEVTYPWTCTHTHTHTHTHTDAKNLTQAMGFTADTYRDIGTMHAEQVF